MVVTRNAVLRDDVDINGQFGYSRGKMDNALAKGKTSEIVLGGF